MTDASAEFFKAVFAIALFACACGIARVVLVAGPNPRFRMALGCFLVLLTLPISYLYLLLAFPVAATALLPLQSMAIWAYGPILLYLLHVVTHWPLRRWHSVLYVAPIATALAARLGVHVSSGSLPAWWEVLSLAQAMSFASVALCWTVRRRAQLAVLTTAFSQSAFSTMAYLSGGWLALLMLDFVIHWRFFVGDPLSLEALYLLVTPLALYVLILCLRLVWRAEPEREEPAIVAATQAVEVVDSPAVERRLELSESAAGTLATELDAVMREQRLHTRNDLALNDLAKALRISTHLTSELLNAHLQTGFYGYINRHRAQEAAALIRERGETLSMADVGYESGFNNPNTFYREFKRVHGMTPAQFKRTPAGGGGVPAPRTTEH